jgi:hypothetical protein
VFAIADDVFFTKESLAPTDIHSKGLGPLLYAFEVVDPVTNERCQLLHTLYPHRPSGGTLDPRPTLQPSSDPSKSLLYKLLTCADLIVDTSQLISGPVGLLLCLVCFMFCLLFATKISKNVSIVITLK